jgi:ISXO2-like transposase domain
VRTGRVRSELPANVTGRAAVGFAYCNVVASSTSMTVSITVLPSMRGDVTTNGIKSVFALLKRGLHGVYHHALPKHLGRYVNEFALILGDGDVKRHTMLRLDSLFAAAIGQRLTHYLRMSLLHSVRRGLTW